MKCSFASKTHTDTHTYTRTNKSQFNLNAIISFVAFVVIFTVYINVWHNERAGVHWHTARKVIEIKMVVIIKLQLCLAAASQLVGVDEHEQPTNTHLVVYARANLLNGMILFRQYTENETLYMLVNE